MHTQTLKVRSGSTTGQRYVLTEDGNRLDIPKNWECLPPGDAAITRKLKSLGPTWTAQRQRGRKIFSDGVWAPAENIELAREMVKQTRSTPEYARKREAEINRRNKKQEAYVGDFYEAVVEFLDFDERYLDLARQMARLITEHATPVGSGTVARTQRIPLPKRAQAAVIAWMRHKTTAYDYMQIERVKGKRREVRRELAQKAIELLSDYRRGVDVNIAACPLSRALGG